MEIQELEKLRNRFITSEMGKSIAALAESICSDDQRAGGIKGYQSGRSDFYKVNPFLIQIKKGFNCRDFSSEENRQHILFLAESIAEKGVLKPLTVYLDQGQLFLADGECRLLATFYAIEKLNAEIQTVPVIMESKGVNEAERVASQIIHNSGKPFTPLEMVQTIKRLLGFGWAPARIAQETTISVAKQNQLLELGAIPEEVKALVAEGAVSPHLAVKTVKEEGNEAAAETLTAAVESAKAQGRKRALPKDLVPKDKEMIFQGKKYIKSAMKDLFEKAYIDNSEDNVIKVTLKETNLTFSDEEFEILTQILKLNV